MNTAEFVPVSASNIAAFIAANGSLRFRDHDFLKTDRNMELHWGELDPALHIPALRSYQRLYRLELEPEVAERFIDANLHSAQQIARMPARRFITQIAPTLALDEAAAARLHRRALGVQNKVFQLWASVRGTVRSPFFRGGRFSNVGSNLSQEFEDLPSYQELFGSLDYCACEECRSIFGAAAYLVDLQRIIDAYITQPNQASIRPGLSFPERRGDIANIELTCANTTTLVPYLQIVNERLTNFVQNTLKLSSLAEVVKSLATLLVYPRILPFNGPLDQINVLLNQVGAPYAQLLAAWGFLPTVVAPRKLGISPDSFAILAKPATTADQVAPFYNVDSADLDSLSDPQLFLAKTNLDFAKLGDLIEEDLSATEIAAGLQVNLFINSSLGGAVVNLSQPEGSQQWKLTNLHVPALDAINRQLRLAETLGWTNTDTDWALRAANAGGTPSITDSALVIVSAIRDLVQNQSLTFLQATALFGPIKTYGQGSGQSGSQFDNLFNTPALVAQVGVYHPGSNALNPTYKDTPLNWTPGSTAAGDVAAIMRVLPGLGLNLTDANTLGLSIIGSSTAQQLTVETLSALYRHVILAQLLGLPINVYVLLLKQLKLLVPGPLQPAQVDQLLSTAAWMAQRGISAYDLDYIVNDVPSGWVALPYQPGTVSTWLQALIQQVGPVTPAAPAQITAQIAVLFGTQATTITPILSMATAAVPLPNPNLSWYANFLAVDTNGEPINEVYVNQVLDRCARWLVLQATLTISNQVITSVAAWPAAYRIGADFAALPLVAITNIDAIQQMIARFGDTQNNLLLYIEDVGKGAPQDTTLADLHQATNWPEAQAKQLLDGPVASITPLVAQLGAMARIFDLMTALGADPSLIQAITGLATAPATTAWASYLDTAQAVLAAVQSQYGGTWPSIAGQLTGRLQVAERDALLALVLTELNAQYEDITTERNVYEYLLIDVEMGPETQISYIKEALNASQLYLQRCRLGLEHGVVELDIAPVWWDWMMNYRVWEANREIFVYPENYLIPTLRKTTTSQFDQLSQDLLQSEVTKDYAAQAFTTYMEGFVAAAQLQPVESYRCTINDPVQGQVGCTFLFAKSNTDPITFYWCQQIDGMPWTAWTEIKLTINADTVSPVYAFGRLFIFWIEIARGSGSSIEAPQGSGSVSTSSTTYKASVSFSFLNTRNTWVQPQSLLSEEIVYYFSNGTNAVSLAQYDIFTGLFDFTKQAWKRVIALHSSDKKFPAPPQQQTSEKICVMYGPFLGTSGQVIDPGTPPTGNDPNALNFYATLKGTLLDHNLVATDQLSGNQLLRRAVVIDGLLEESVLLRNQEFYLFDTYLNPAPLNQVSAQFSSTDASLLLMSSPTIISDNLVSDPNEAIIGEAASVMVTPATFVSLSIDPTTAQNIFQALVAAKVIVNSMVDRNALATVNLVTALDALITVPSMASPPSSSPALSATPSFTIPQIMDVQKALFASVGGTALFGKVSPLGSRIATVKNQPGSFLLYSDNEIFLLAAHQNAKLAPQPIFSALDESISVALPTLTPASFVLSYTANGTSYTIDATTSSQIYQVSVLSNFIKNGVFVASTTFGTFNSTIGAYISSLNTDQIRACYNVANNTPAVRQDVFVNSSQGIDSTVSATIYQALASYSIIDVTGRVSSADLLIPGLVKQALGNPIMNKVLTPYQVPFVYQTLAQAPGAVALTYTNSGDASAFSGPGDFTFSVTRLSTSAVRKLDQALFAGSVDVLLSPEMQGYPVLPVMPFSRFAPNMQNIIPPTALDGTQVDFDGLYGQYFWEIFFHVPRLVASMLESNQNYQDALAWLQYIFNPTRKEQFVTAAVLSQQTNNAINSTTAPIVITQLQQQTIGQPLAPILDAQGRVNSALTPATDLSFLTGEPAELSSDQVLMVQAILLNFELSAPTAHYWSFFPFRNYTLPTLQQMLTDGAAIQVYNNDPFDPFAIARLRIGAFEKATVMQYIDALIQWGDMLFTQDTWESITAASLLYVYASDLLGPRPVEVGECPGSATPVTFSDIKKAYAGQGGGIPQFLIDLEHLVPGGNGPNTPIIAHAFNELNVYFCVPENSQFMSYWDTVDDRLNKIEHSMNIQGQFRTLALFEPPLNPLDLVKAAAAGNNVQGAIPAGGPPSTLPYRFESSLAFARRVLDSVSGFGAALLSALEKQDAEGLSLLQATQASQILNMTIQLKQQHVAEIQDTAAALQASLQSAQYRVQYYGSLIQNNLLPEEETSLDAMEKSMVFNILSSALNTAAAIGYAVPQVGSPFAMTYGGIQLGNVIQAGAGVAQIGAEISNYVSQRSQTMAGYQRRKDDWTYQQQLATYDVQQITSNQLAVQAQLAQAQQDLQITTQQYNQNQAITTYLTSKFTNRQLYAWMASRLAAIYFQGFQVALQAAQAVQAAYQFETDTDTTFISFEYWNSLYKGLLAGEGLRAALDQMENSYRSTNTRRFEIIKVVSLALTDPEALMALKATGTCNFQLTEAAYDYDYPGQYARKITSVSVSIPALIGPYQTVKAVLTQASSKIVIQPNIGVVKYLLGLTHTQPTSGLRVDWMKNQAIAVSQGVDDSGMFTLNFNDERYLPFENTGAVSDWTLEMPLTTNRFDFSQLSDVIITVRYTALTDASFQSQVQQALAQVPYQGGIYIDSQRQQPTAWNAFVIDRRSPSVQSLTLSVNPSQFGFFQSVNITTVLVRLDLGAGVTLADGSTFLSLTAGTQPATQLTISKNIAELDKLQWKAPSISGDWVFNFDLTSPNIQLLLSNGYIDPSKLVDMEIIIVYIGKIF